MTVKAKKNNQKKSISVISLLILLTLPISLASCSSYRPVLDENETLQEAGHERAQQDINECMAAAERYIRRHRQNPAPHISMPPSRYLIEKLGPNYARMTMEQWKAKESAAPRAPAYAVGQKEESTSINTDEVTQRYVTHCLSRKKYEVIGWK